jgi:cobalt-zinc-cadmium resistance protein CzcA
MLSAIITWSLNHRIIVLLGAAALVVAGVVAWQALGIDAFPDTTPVQVQVNAYAPALAPVEMEQQVTVPIEQRLGNLPGVVRMYSQSKFGLAQVVVVFADGTDVYFARNQISERLNAVELPAGIARPRLGPVATGLGEVMHYVVRSTNGPPDEKTLTQLRTVQDWVVRPPLRTVPGTAEINSWGGLEKQYQVRIDPARLRKFGLTFQQVTEAVQANHLNVGGGDVKEAGEMLLVHGTGAVAGEDPEANRRALAALPVSAPRGQPVYLRDVADVTLGHEIRRGAMTADGKGEAVLGLGFMLMGENSHDFTHQLKAKLAQTKVPDGTTVETLYDRTELVDQVIETVKHNLFEGGLLVVAVLFAFLGNLRAGLIVALAIPLSMMFAFCGMWRFGIAGSLLSLGALDFGLVVDSSVVLVENVVRHLSHGDDRDRKTVVRDAAVEVRGPTLFGELIILIVYVPILTLQGVEGKMFRPMALTVIFALLGSLVLSLTVMPALASLVLPRRVPHHDPVLVRLFRTCFAPVLRLALRFRYAVLGLALASLFVAVLMARGLGSEFVPTLAEGAVAGNLIRLAGTDVNESIRMNTLFEETVRSEFKNEVEHVWCRLGTAEVATDPMGVEYTDFFITLKPRDQWKRAKTQDELIKVMKQELGEIKGQKAAFSQPIQQRMDEMATGSKAQIAIKLFGDDFDTLEAKADEIVAAVKDVPGAGDVGIPDQLLGQPVLQVEPKRAELARYGVPVRQVFDLIESLGSKPLGEVREGQLRFPLVVRLPEEYRKNPVAVGDIPFTTANGERMPLSRLVDLKTVDQPATIGREEGQRRVTVQVNVRDRDVGSFVREAREAVAKKVQLPTGGRYRIEWGGQFENLQRASARLTFVVPAALVLIFVLLYLSFGSLLDAVRVFTGVPFAAVGGVAALWLRGMPFSVSAAVGFIALSGVSVLNSLLLVTFVRQLRDRGMPVRQAVEEAVLARLRPVLMTALVAGLGFVPMATSEGVGAEVQRPLATVVIGGVISSTLLTLVVLPVLYVVTGEVYRFGRMAGVSRPVLQPATGGVEDRPAHAGRSPSEESINGRAPETAAGATPAQSGTASQTQSGG